MVTELVQLVGVFRAVHERFKKIGQHQEKSKNFLNEKEWLENLESEEKQNFKEKSFKYFNDIMGQIQYNKRLYKEKQEEEQRIIEKAKDAEIEYRAKLDDIKARPISANAHPFYIMKNQSKISTELCYPHTFCRSGTIN
ncbi:hypothetical protein HELRODRAFT_164108 [Helobdella robusta]|uniref:Uncharacterized protein n=1 Tax=Helobdella robusta TaxID=6412 RepID=T1EUX8_HELRO|nr:hypothetical protein HELRODRAFT_164108 [Helobdella robusta]ESN94293.1 hypothetical protein HELRODRAFT_164108 [Helobdella robusta]